jgi:arylsulfatase A-like enzyme
LRTRSVLQVVVLGIASAVASPAAPARPPNLLFILADNQGAWQLGCYGNPDIRTPHIDRLASEGIRFTRALSSNPVCSPTRATFLTGLIPSQHGVHSFMRRDDQMGNHRINTLEEFTSLGEILRDAGYACGLVGKWHLGNAMIPAEGFSHWVTKPYGGTNEFYDQEVIEDGRLRVEAGYTTEFWTRKGIEFLERNRDRPFFLFLAYNGPYSLGTLVRNPPRNRHASHYKGHLFASFPQDAPHPWQKTDIETAHRQNAAERVAAETSGVDDGVGDVMAALDRLGLAENTLVVYAADQGWMGGQNGMWGMGDSFRPIGAHELMMQIPLIFRHAARILAGQTSDLLVSNYDFLPSVLGYLGLPARMPAQPRSPGRDFSPALRGETIAWDHAVFYEMENTRAIRTDRWKYVARHPSGPFELYDMRADPRERFNLYGQPGAAATRAELAARLEKFFAEHADPRYDLWKNGRSKANRLVP